MCYPPRIEKVMRVLRVCSLSCSTEKVMRCIVRYNCGDSMFLFIPFVDTYSLV